ncbi:outer membrane vitamin B12 receptor BtuB [alpha proteobacterium U9-1i]|nr:outer membrane vitamin B12 receptor BtuB [alpha proteobacterium U9-1i]
MRHTLKIAALLLSSLVALPAYAQSDEIVVTATRTPTPLAQLPARIEVINRDDFEARSITTLAEAVGSTAVQGGGAGQQSSVFLRGANSKHALALFDGIRLNDSAGPNAAYDFGQDTLGAIQRVEVLRGPASSIYGSDAVGGVVNIIPRRGGEQAFAPFLELAVGSFETVRGFAGAAGATNGFEYGVSGEFLETEGFDAVPERIVTHTGDEDSSSISTFTASVRHDGGVFAFDALVRARETEAEYDTFSGGAFFDLRADDSDLENESSQRLWRLGAEMEGGSALNFRLSGGQVLSQRGETDSGFQTSAAESDRTFADLVATYAHGPVTLTSGVAFERNEIETQPQFANPLSVGEDQVGVYAIGQYAFNNVLTATGSIRWDDYDQFGARTTYGAGIVANLASLRLFASYATAFKAPSLSERFEQSFFNIGNPDLEAEESQSWEIGADWTLNPTLTLGASYYQTRIDNMINYNFGLLQNVNVDEAEIDGAEAYVETALTDWASIRLAYAWTDARDAIADRPLTRRPEHALMLDARVSPTERLAFSLSWDYVGERTDVTYSDAGAFISSNREVDGFHVGALAATYKLDDRAEVFARIDNLTDETYEQPAAFAASPRAGTIGVRARF